MPLRHNPIAIRHSDGKMPHFKVKAMENVLVKKPAKALRGVWLLYCAAFAMSIALSVWWTAMPFVIRNIGGTEGHVGYAWAANMLGYMVCLLLAGAAMGEHNPKNTTRIAAAVNFASALAISIMVYVILSGGFSGNAVLIWVIIAVGTLAGAAMSLYWPFLMSWVSEDLEGAALNRRLGTYNCTWSGASIMVRYWPVFSSRQARLFLLYLLLYA